MPQRHRRPHSSAWSSEASRAPDPEWRPGGAPPPSPRPQALGAARPCGSLPFTLAGLVGFNATPHSFPYFALEFSVYNAVDDADDEAKKRYAELEDEENEDYAELGGAEPAADAQAEQVRGENNDARQDEDENLGDDDEEKAEESMRPNEGAFNKDQMPQLPSQAQEEEAEAFVDAQDKVQDNVQGDQDHLQDLLNAQEEDRPDHNDWLQPNDKD